jgi:hypothetical protein
MFNSSSNVMAAGINKIDLWKVGINNNNNNNDNKAIRSKILLAENQQQLSNTIALAKKEVKESNVVNIIQSELKPCDNNDLILFTARLDYREDSDDDYEDDDNEEERDLLMTQDTGAEEEVGES